MTLCPHFRSLPHNKHTRFRPLLSRVGSGMCWMWMGDLEARLLRCWLFLVSSHQQHNLLLLSATAGGSAEMGSTITHSLRTSLLILRISVWAKLRRRRCWEVHFWLLWRYNYAWHPRQLGARTYTCTSFPQWLTRETRAEEFKARGTIHTNTNRWTPSDRTIIRTHHHQGIPAC